MFFYSFLVSFSVLGPIHIDVAPSFSLKHFHSYQLILIRGFFVDTFYGLVGIFIFLEGFIIDKGASVNMLLKMLSILVPESKCYIIYILDFWKAPWKSSCVSLSMTFVTASFISSIVS